jgi:type IV secretory pathway VirD2 relaxase
MQAMASLRLPRNRNAIHGGHALRMGRLRALERMGLAEETTPGSWRIVPDLEPTLRRMGERGDIIKIMHRELKAAGIERAVSDHAIFDPHRMAASSGGWWRKFFRTICASGAM